MSGYVWVEKYRPTEFDNIVLEPINKQILQNIINTSYFPNLLLFGPPGTGKTTTIINLIDAYQEKLGIKNKKDFVIHLNASDDRGIDIIRTPINSFVNSKPLFNNGMKFVILDEIDYMTKNAQQALRYLLQNYSSSVRFCLICNYISKIDEGLQNEFMRLRFNQLPNNLITKFLKNISVQENLHLSDETILNIQKLFKSDIRSMINFMQSNQDIVKQSINYDKDINDNENDINDINDNDINENKLNCNIIEDKIWENILLMIREERKLTEINCYIHEISKNYNIDKKNIIKNFFNYIIRNNVITLTGQFLNFIENITHTQNINNNIYVNYSISSLYKFIKA